MLYLFQYHIYKWEEHVDNTAIFFRNQVLTTTIAGNGVPVLTITAQPAADDPEAIEQLSEWFNLFTWYVYVPLCTLAPNVCDS